VSEIFLPNIINIC